MADIQRSDFPDSFSLPVSTLITTEKSLLLLREGLPVEKQELYTTKIQDLSSQRLSFFGSISSQSPFQLEQNLQTLNSLQSLFSSALNQMISEITDSELLDYNENEGASKLLRRRKSSTKEIIFGSLNESLDTMDRILATGESLIVQGYQKLFIDNLSMKDKLQAVIDEKQNLPSCSKPLDTLVLKQKFCEKQLGCLLTLLEQANTLTDLINKMQEFDRRQIQFQQASQITTEAMRKFFYRSDVRRPNERRRTCLTVSYADPSNTRESLDILRDQINSVIRNLNNLCDMEDAKVRTVKKSDLGDECEQAYDEALNCYEEERELLKKTLGVLVAIEDNQVDLEKSDEIIEEFRVPEESPQNQLDYIKFFVKLGMSSSKMRLEQAKLINSLVNRFDQDHSTYFNLVENLQNEVLELSRENKQLKTQVQGKVIEQISEGSHSLKELIELQEHLRSSIQEEIESAIRKPVNEIALLAHASASLLLEMNPDDDLKMRQEEFDNEYAFNKPLVELVDLVSKQTAWIFRIVSKVGRLAESLVHTNISNLKKARNLREGREGILGKPSEYPLATMDRVLSDMIKAYLTGLDERRGNLDSVVQKQAALSRLLREYKS